MRRLIYPFALAALAVALVPAATATTSKTVSVSITRSAFVPKDVSIAAGDTLKWTNNDTIKHEVRCTKCPFTSPVLNAGDSYSHTFKTIGKFPITDPLHMSLKGTVRVVAGPKSITLKAVPKTVKFGTDTTLSGQISTKTQKNVSLFDEPCGQASFAKVSTTTSGMDGSYSFTQTPLMNTAYEAKWSGTTSKSVTVNVRPRIKLAKIASHKYRVKVKAADGFVGKHVLFQKRTADGTWVKVKSVKLTTSSTSGTTTVTKAKFKSKIRHQKKVRILMKKRQAAPCYVSGHSNTIRS